MSRLKLLIGLGILVSLSGCATISVTTEVGSENVIESYEMDISTSTQVYGYLNEAAKDEGYESLRNQIESEQNLSEDNFEYSQEIDGNDATIHIKATDIDVNLMDGVSITKNDGGTLTFIDTTFYNESAETDESSEAFMSGMVLEYTLIMPGDVTVSNADEVDGNTANWSRTGADAWGSTSIEAESNGPSLISVPGFGAVSAVIAIALVSLALFVRRRNSRKSI